MTQSSNEPPRHLADRVDYDSLIDESKCLCSKIERLFRNKGSSDAPCSNKDAKERIISDANRWVQDMVKRTTVPIECETYRYLPRATVADAIATLLRTLDDVDVANLRVHRRKRIEIKQPQPPGSRKRRPGLPPNMGTADFIQAMHDGGDNFCLSNSDRHRRAKRSLLNSRQSCSMAGITMKEVMHCAQGSNGDGESVEIDSCVVTSLSHDGAVLRRDLYKLLQTLDTYDIRQSTAHAISDKERVPAEVEELADTLLDRISDNPTSPSMRLSAIITLDSLREIHLGDLGYRCISDRILIVPESRLKLSVFSSALKFHAEIVSECSAYEMPRRLLRQVNGLMHLLLMKSIAGKNEAASCIQELQSSLSHIMVRRQSILSSFNNQYDVSAGEKVLMDEYRSLCARISVSYDADSWVHPMMPRVYQEKILSVLRAEGILSFFCGEGSDNHQPATGFGETMEEYPHAKIASLRTAHERMGTCDGANWLLSHHRVYSPHTASNSPTTSVEARNLKYAAIDGACPFPLMHCHEDILNIIFSYLSYRSLSRASQCCIAWNRTGKLESLWIKLYFRAFPSAFYMEELVLGKEVPSHGTFRCRAEMASTCDNGSQGHCFGKFLSLRSAFDRVKLAESLGYDWHFIFKNKYALQKDHCKGRYKICHIVGCTDLIRCGSSHTISHYKRHEKALWVQYKKHNNHNELQQKVADLRLRITSILPKEEAMPLTHNKEIIGPGDVMRCLVFQYLDVTDITKPVCKLWKRSAECNELWKSLYHIKFGNSHTAWLSETNTSSWKTLFKDAFAASINLREKCNRFVCRQKGKCLNCKRPWKYDGFGFKACLCPLPGCNSVLESKFERDIHVLKHEKAYYLDQIKQMKKKPGK